MSDVEFLIDPNKISLKQVDFEISGSTLEHHEIISIRKLIHEHLLQDGPNQLTLRLDDAWLLKFKDFKGLRGVKITPISSITELSRVLKSDLPAWCTNDLINEYKLLEHARNSKIDLSLPIDIRILSIFSPAIVEAKDHQQLLLAISKTSQRIYPYLVSNVITKHFYSLLALKFLEPQIEELFKIFKSDNCFELIKILFQHSFYENIRTKTSKFKLAITCPGLEFDKKLLAQLGISPTWSYLIETEPYLSKLTTQVIEKVRKKDLPPEVLSEIVFIYSLNQVHQLTVAIKNDPIIATPQLIEALDSLATEDVSKLTNLIKQLTDIKAPADFDITWTAKQAHSWADEYLKFAKSQFQRGLAPEGKLTDGFEEWINSQTLRAQSPPYGWREVSKRVSQSLSKNKLVVLIIVDALGSIMVEELIKDINASVQDSINLEHINLFSLIPTLTEVCKIAVATGYESFKLPSNTEQALILAYKDFLHDVSELQVIKSWKEGDRFINEGTKLVVYFENQLDEQLHECIKFSDLEDQLSLVCQRLTKFISEIYDENGINYQNTEVIITADHGLTRASEFSCQTFKDLGKIGDRHIKSDMASICPEDFWDVEPEGSKKGERFFVPKSRTRLTTGSKPFVHGGLLPEEVLIPCIQIKSKFSNEKTQSRVEIKSRFPEVTLTSNGWLVNLELIIGNFGIKMFTLDTPQPFNSNQFKRVKLPSNYNLEFSITITSEIQQSGYVKLKFDGRYFFDDDINEKIVHELDVFLPEHNLLKDQGAQDFDDMFN